MRAFWPWLRVLLGAAVLALLVRTLGAEPFVRAVGMIGAPALAAALGIGAVTTLAAAGRWMVVARGMGLRLDAVRAVADYYRALVLNAVLPAGVLGDVHRAYEHGRTSAAERAGGAGRAVRAVVLERAAGQAVLISVAAAVLVLRPDLLAAAARTLPSAPSAVASAGLVLAAGGACAVWLLRSERGRRLLRRARAWAAEARAALLHRGQWPAVAGLSAAALAGHLSLFVVAARIAGTDAPVAELLPPLLLALLAMSLPIGVGGWGPRESAAALGFAAVGLGAELGLRAAVVYGVLALVASVPGVIALVPLKRPRPRRAAAAPPGSEPAAGEAARRGRAPTGARA
ncbi:lysylphosphatidylglycerol synthase domain-containing protein [Streptomonospora wellingtoniae]|uniref:Lysylphosphatidylglycerol synthase domain-containing protein n=1 Tax=Streptomonospora wellingtoniae TaxID=3075544 RepID=A0ABU2KRC9_9ACTN|nr:lysylphosphatidylglycerol synthase domain-containing protein [Streptomonospora sp. DSM 45055]MDT0301846.1 lysylphosphatidylglycerol synthase domain-containing protein [Streptomonospora sp. DSM 45055]